MLNIILGGLIGSAVTVIISKILDMIQEGKKHKYSLRKMFFEKKLISIEEAVKEWYSLASTTSNLIVFYEQLMMGEEKIAPEMIHSVYGELSSQLEKASNQYLKRKDAILLYFDIEDELWNQEYFKKYLTCLSTISIATKRIQICLDIYSKFKGTDQENMASAMLQTAYKSHNESLKSSNDLLKDVFEQNRRLIQHARSLMKEYES